MTLPYDTGGWLTRVRVSRTFLSHKQFGKPETVIPIRAISSIDASLGTNKIEVVSGHRILTIRHSRAREIHEALNEALFL